MSTHPTYYEDNSVSIEAIDVMDYLHPALANAFKYLVRAGSKPDNSWEQDAYKALTYIGHWRRFKNVQPEHPEAFSILKLFCTRSCGDLHAIILKSHDIESFVDVAEDYIDARMCAKESCEELHGYINEIARLKHQKLPYPDLKD